MSWEIRQGDCAGLMAAMDPAIVDAIVTDPPYGLAFMGRTWDHGVPGVPFWAEALRVAKPGAHLAAFGGTRTFHRLACAIEDAGFEIRDCLCWLYGSGFPKSLDVSKAIDKAAGAEREVVGVRPGHEGFENRTDAHSAGARRDGWDRPWKADEEKVRLHHLATAPSTDAAKQWAGFGTALKPAWEPIILARKPLAGTVAQNVVQHGTGALNIDGCRIEGDPPTTFPTRRTPSAEHVFMAGFHRTAEETATASPLGRWPANLVLDEESARALDEQSGELGISSGTEVSGEAHPNGIYGSRLKEGRGQIGKGDSGGASRFFYTAKASAGERHYAGRNVHPTVKPVSLMRWLVRLVTPPGGLVLDPFMGSGSTGIAALSEGMRFLGLEIDPDSCATARRRIAGPLFADA